MKALASRARFRGLEAVGGWACSARRVTIAIVASACVLGSAAAQLDVDPAGGPLTLPEEVAEAFATWQDAFANELTEPTATLVFGPELLGPDTASLTLRWEDGRTEVVLAPARYRSGPVLVHEIGVLLGLPEIGPGVMDPALTAEAPPVPTDEDVALLRDLFTYPAADLTRDGTVDFYDLAAFGAAYGSVGINLRADLNGDGRVDDADLDVLREAYGFSPPSAAPPEPANLTPLGNPAEPGAEEDGAPIPGDEASDETLDEALDETQDDAQSDDAESEDDSQDEDPAPSGEDEPDGV